MQVAILADIHANLAALTAVQADIERHGGAEEVWCLGDIVGYGPEPRECIAAVRHTVKQCVAGNHDLAAIGRIDTSYFNPDAAAASHWTAEQLDEEDRQYLNDLPLVIEQDEFTLVHGTPQNPVWEYLTSARTAAYNLPYLRTKYCLVGHSHQPLVFSYDDAGAFTVWNLMPDEPIVLGENQLFINPGGVGQPRDGDPRASYAIYNSDEQQVRLYRVPYDIASTQTRMQAVGLPARLSARLSHGI